MLRWMMYDPQNGDDLFIKMMHDFTEANAHRNATAETFQATVEKYMKPGMDLDHNRKMDWFFKEWVYGTDVPRYRFDYTVTPADGGKFTLKASLTQSEVSDAFKMLVPIYLDYDGRVVRMGQVTITGNTTESDITVTLPRKPNRVLINAHLDVLSAK
jgi:aminopeptidase N